jgi:Flp pilus assembly protein TadD
MCYGVLSSTIRAHREKLPPLPKVYDDRFFEDLRRYLPHLRDAKFFGGEPFLAQENYRIWDMMIEDGITIPCHVTTNGTQWSKKVERILEALPCSISVSIDGTTKATVESVRVNANFEEVRQNADRFLAYTRKRGTYFTLTYCLMRQNWFEFGDYLKYADERRVQVFINTVIDPPNCSLYTLPPAELAAIVKQMEEMDAREGYSKLRKNGGVWTSGVEALRKNADERQRQGISDVRKTLVSRDPIAHAWAFAGAGKYDAALAEVAAIESESASYYSRLCLEGHVLRMQKRMAEAGMSLDEAITLSPKSPHAYVERAWTHIDQRQFAEGLACAEQAVQRLSPGHEMAVYAYALLGSAHGRLGHREEAVRAMERAVSLQPDSPSMHLQSAWMFWELQLFVDAQQACKRALELAPDNAEAQHLRDLLAAKSTSPNQA